MGFAGVERDSEACHGKATNLIIDVTSSQITAARDIVLEKTAPARKLPDAEGAPGVVVEQLWGMQVVTSTPMYFVMMALCGGFLVVFRIAFLSQRRVIACGDAKLQEPSVTWTRINRLGSAAQKTKYHLQKQQPLRILGSTPLLHPTRYHILSQLLVQKQTGVRALVDAHLSRIN